MKKNKNISIVPSLYEKYYNQIEYSLDVNWIKFFREVYKNSEVKIFNKNEKNKSDLIVLCGGNDLPIHSKKKSDLIRNNMNKLALQYAIEKKIPIIGICLGALFISKKFKSIIKLSKKHANKVHKIYFLTQKKNERKVNSYHNYIIAKLSDKFEALAVAKDNSIELFKHKKKSIYGLMWHPERNRIFSKEDKKLFRNICN